VSEQPSRQFEAGPHTYFPEYGTESILDCLFGYLQFCGNIGVRKSLPNESHDHFLSRGQRFVRSWGFILQDFTLLHSLANRQKAVNS
jgi:hypothetical protein